MKIASKISNRGTVNANNVQVRYSIGGVDGPFDIGTSTVDIPANSTITNEISWRANKIGENLPVTVAVDPLNAFSELSKANNNAFTFVTVYAAPLEPDLSIKGDDIAFVPPSITSLPSNVQVNATVWNLGRTDVFQAKVVLYDGAVADLNKVGEQVVALPGQASVKLSFTTEIKDGNEHRFYVSVDPDNLVIETNKSKNLASKILYPDSTYDFETLASDLSLTPNVATIGEDVKITAKVRNKGTMNAYNVQVKYYIDEAGAPFDIGTSTVNIPANATTTSEITWKTNRAGASLPITVQVDPFNKFSELSKANNKATTYLTVNNLQVPNVAVSYQDITITPSPARERGSANISALIKNNGFASASSFIEVRKSNGTK